MKTVTSGRDPQGQPIWMPARLQLASEFGFHPEACTPGAANQKPKVERNVAYARESFFRDRDFLSLATMREAARKWCLDVAGRRVHGTTGERPLEALLELEQKALLPLPPQPWAPASGPETLATAATAPSGASSNAATTS
jgi:hypothetical protein